MGLQVSKSLVIMAHSKQMSVLVFLRKCKKQYGLKEKMDITVTTDQEIDIASILEYADKSYRIEQVIPFDSHYLLFCKEWQSKF